MDPPCSWCCRGRTGDQDLDVVAERRHQVRDRRTYRRPVGDDAAAGHVHLHARADLLARVRAWRSSLHALLRVDHVVQCRHAHDGARREHGGVDPRLGDHGFVLVPVDRALVGGASQQRGCPEGLPHRPRRRRRHARRHGHHVRSRRHDVDQRAARMGQRPSDEPHRAAVVRRRIVHRLHRQERPVPAAHLAPRRNGRPDARQLAAALVDDGRGRCLPRCTPVPRVPRRVG